MYCTPVKTITAKKEHQCTYCNEIIKPGETYLTWASVDDSWYTNKMHPECENDLQSLGESDYFPGENERPKQPKEITL